MSRADAAVLRIAVLLGGDSAERDVSIASAAQVVRALRSAGHVVLAVDTMHGLLDETAEQQLFGAGIGLAPAQASTASGVSTRDPLRDFNRPELAAIDLVFPVLHGGYGEDGHLQAMLEWRGLPYAGSGVLGSACAMDKDIAKRLMRGAGVPTPDWCMAPVAVDVVAREVGWPAIVKPSKQGSTVGLSVVREASALAAAIALAQQHDDEVLVERFVPGRELTVGVLGQQALAVGEIVLGREQIFDYAAKYQPGGAREVFPAELPATVCQQAQDHAVRVARALKLQDFCRVDFRLDDDEGLWCLEVNTLPGMTATSLLPQSSAACGIPFASLCDRICRLALLRQSA